MAKVSTRHECWVCLDCYFALNFGANGVENPDPRWSRAKFEKSISVGEWSDWHCVCHEYESSWCEFCDSDDDGTKAFSYMACDTCETPAAGSRHRLAQHL
jgi:hypothetical protein